MNYSVFKFWIILLEASLLLILIRYYLRLWKCKIFYPQDVSYNKWRACRDWSVPRCTTVLNKAWNISLVHVQ